MGNGFQFVGQPWWLVMPLAALAAWAIGRIAQVETARLPGHIGTVIVWLRRSAVALIVLMLLEPVYARIAIVRELPSVAIVVDRSGSMGIDDRSMHPTHRLNEAEALGLLARDLRPDAGRTLHQRLERLAEDLPELARTVAGPSDPGHERMVADRFSAIHQVLAERVPASMLDALPELERINALLAQALASFDAPLASGIDHAHLAEQIVALVESVRALASRALQAQGAADTALVAGAEAGSPVAKALGEVASRTRERRAFDLVKRHIAPQLEGRAQVEYFTTAGEEPGGTSSLQPVDNPDLPLRANGSTDLASPLTWLSRNWTSRNFGAIILCSDGRQTVGGDPVPVARALAARGARVSTVCVGDPDPPRDAAVASIAGPGEIFRGETVHLDVRWRVSGFGDRGWDLVLSCAGREVARRLVHGDGSWQVARFVVPASELPQASDAPVTFVVRIEPSRSLPNGSPIRPGAGLLREVWNGVGGQHLADFFLSGIAPRRADDRSVIDQARVVDNRQNYASRLRGWLIPPETGSYTLWISGDDETEAWLGVSGTPYDRVRIASVPEWTHADEWDRFAAQRSLPIELTAGQPCYLEILHKQGSGGGHLAIGWQTPSNRLERPIPLTALAPWSDGLNPETVEEPEQPEVSLLNNRAELAIMINEDPLRILVIDHHPRWELRYATALFERDRRIEVVRRYRSIRLPRGEQELVPAEQADVDAFDVVVLGDLTPAELPAEDQRRLARFVSQRGGFLVAVGGPRGMPWGYSLGDLADALPIRAGTAPEERRSIHLALAPDATDHPITRILDDPAMNQRLWHELPPLQWAATAVTAKPGAQVLVQAADAGDAPIIVVGRFGAGRVAWIGTDETWRWRDRLGDRVHQAFWLQVMRWGLGSRLRGSDRRLQVALDRPLIQPNESVDLRARTMTDEGLPGSAPNIIIERVEESGTVQAGSRIVGAVSRIVDTDLWSMRIGDLAEGRWRITVKSGEVSEIRELLVRGRPGSEGVEIGADAAALARIAEAGGGMAVDAAGIERLGAALRDSLSARVSERRTTLSLWQTHIALIIIVGLLSCEWFWRKRRGLP